MVELVVPIRVGEVQLLLWVFGCSEVVLQVAAPKPLILRQQGLELPRVIIFRECVELEVSFGGSVVESLGEPNRVTISDLADNRVS